MRNTENIFKIIYFKKFYFNVVPSLINLYFEIVFLYAITIYFDIHCYNTNNMVSVIKTWLKYLYLKLFVNLYDILSTDKLPRYTILCARFFPRELTLHILLFYESFKKQSALNFLYKNLQSLNLLNHC